MAIEYSIIDEQLGPAMLIKILYLPLLMMSSMQQRMKKQAWIFATMHGKDFSNPILLCNYVHATFSLFSTAYALHLQVILMRVVWQSYGILFSTTIWHTMKKVRQLQFDCWEFQKFQLSANLMIAIVFCSLACPLTYFQAECFFHLNN